MVGQGGNLEAQAPSVGAEVNGGSVDRRQGHQRRWHSPSRASTASGCSSEHGKGVKVRQKGSGEAGHGSGVIATAVGYSEAATCSIEPKGSSFSPMCVA